MLNVTRKSRSKNTEQTTNREVVIDSENASKKASVSNAPTFPPTFEHFVNVVKNGQDQS